MASSYIKPVLDNLQEISDKLERIGRRALIENMDEVIFVITEMQWGQGLDASGATMGWYTPKTEEEANDPYNKPRSNKIAGDPYNLDWTGELYNTIALRFESDATYSIYSTVGKVRFLERELSDIKGQKKRGLKVNLSKLTKENNEYINQEIVIPYVYKYILEHLFPMNYFI